MEKLNQEDIGFWLKVARESINMSQEDAADRIGIPRSAISLAEAGKRSVTSVELNQFANVYHRPVNFFLRKKEAELPHQILLRAEMIRPQDSEFLVDLYEFFKEYSMLEKMVLGSLNYEVPQYLISRHNRRYQTAIEEGEHLATDERGRLKLGHAPISDIYAVLEREGIKIYKKEFPSASKISGCFFFAEDIGPCIAVNTFQRLQRTNFTAAHEYCHFLRDRLSVGDYACDLRTLGEQNELFEIRANSFAAGFLMPADGVTEYLKELGASKKRPLGIDQVVKCQRYFGVSYQAMLFRLRNLKWLNDNEFETLKVFRPSEVARRLGFDSEKHDESPPFPPRYTYLVVEAYRRKKISLAKLCELLKISRKEATEFLKSLKIEIRQGGGTEEELHQEIAGA